MNNIDFRVAETEKDFEGLKNICQEIFDQEVKDLADDLFYRSPKNDKNICLCAVDQEKDKYVGILCLLDTPVRFGDITVKTAEYAIAGTIEKYRGQGINNKLTQLFFEKCRELDYELIIIEGIPYFYRRYGFNYVIPKTVEKLNLDKLDLEIENKNKLNIRKAKDTDINYLVSACNSSAKDYEIFTIKDEEIIRAQITKYTCGVAKKNYYILENQKKRVGYFTLNPYKDFQICDISSNLTFAQYEAVLSHFKEKGNSKITTNLKKASKFVKYLRCKGSTGRRRYAFQLKILDEYIFLRKIKPVLEQRIASSIYKNENIILNYNNYQEIIQFKIKNSNITFAKLERGEIDSNFSLIPQGAIKLFFGENKMSEIADFLPDCYVQEEFSDLIDILFPELATHFYINY